MGGSYGVEAAVHAARIFLHLLQPGHLLLKLDFKNGFNCFHRQKMLIAVRDQVPELLPLVLSVYGAPSCLLFGQEIIQSSEGVQQCDPLGPLLLCLTIHNMVEQLCSQLNVFYTWMMVIWEVVWKRYSMISVQWSVFQENWAYSSIWRKQKLSAVTPRP